MQKSPSTTKDPTKRPCTACRGGYVTGPADVRRLCPCCHGAGEL